MNKNLSELERLLLQLRSDGVYYTDILKVVANTISYDFENLKDGYSETWVSVKNLTDAIECAGSPLDRTTTRIMGGDFDKPIRM